MFRLWKKNQKKCYFHFLLTEIIQLYTSCCFNYNFGPFWGLFLIFGTVLQYFTTSSSIFSVFLHFFARKWCSFNLGNEEIGDRNIELRLYDIAFHFILLLQGISGMWTSLNAGESLLPTTTTTTTFCVFFSFPSK